MRHDEETRRRLAQDALAMGVDEACRRHGVHRSTWYRWARESTAPATTDPKEAIRNRILSIAREHPTWGCDRIAFYLSFEGLAISSPTVQKHLLALGLGRRIDRIAAASLDDDRPSDASTHPVRDGSPHPPL